MLISVFFKNAHEIIWELSEIFESWHKFSLLFFIWGWQLWSISFYCPVCGIQSESTFPSLFSLHVLFKVFFFPRTINEWNELPSEAVSVGEAKLFRAELDTHMYSKRVQGLAFPIETAPMAGSFTPFKPFNAYFTCTGPDRHLSLYAI